jgi:hypothetical protein
MGARGTKRKELRFENMVMLFLMAPKRKPSAAASVSITLIITLDFSEYQEVVISKTSV